MMAIAHAKLSDTVAEMQSMIENDYTKSPY